MSRRTAEKGFTLLEVLIAFVILALVLGSLLPLFSSGFRGLARSESQVMASLQARSLLAEVGGSVPLEEGSRSGDFADGRVWSLQIERSEALEGEQALRGALLPFAVTVTVNEPGKPGVSLTTLRLGAER